MDNIVCLYLTNFILEQGLWKAYSCPSIVKKPHASVRCHIHKDRSLGPRPIISQTSRCPPSVPISLRSIRRSSHLSRSHLGLRLIPFPKKNCMHFISSPCLLHVHLKSINLVTPISSLWKVQVSIFSFLCISQSDS